MITADIQDMKEKLSILVLMNIGLLGVLITAFIYIMEIQGVIYEGYSSIEEHKILKYEQMTRERDSIMYLKLDTIERELNNK